MKGNESENWECTDRQEREGNRDVDDDGIGIV